MSESVPRKGYLSETTRCKTVRPGEVLAYKSRDSWRCTACGQSLLPTINQALHNESCPEHPLNNLPAWVKSENTTSTARATDSSEVNAIVADSFFIKGTE